MAIRLMTVVLLAIFLPGCPYDSNVPLGTPQRLDVDGRLTGQWIWEDPKGKNASILVSVLPFNGAEYLVDLVGSKGELLRYRAFQVRVGDQLFWNINRVDGSSPSDGPGMLAFLKSHLADPLLDDDDGAYLWRRPKPDGIKEGRLQSWSARIPS